MSVISSGRALFIVANLFYSVGSFIADYSVTHVFNPRWMPHAKFHNGQTMSLSVMLASLSIALLFLPTDSPRHRKQNLLLAATVGSLYCAAAMCASLFPGTAWSDPEFETSVPAAQAYIFGIQLVAVWVAYWLEIRRLRKLKAI